MLQTDWAAISSRIRGLQAALTVYFPAVNSGGSDYYAVSATAVLPLAQAVFADIDTFRERHVNRLPPTVVASLDRFLADHRDLFRRASGIAGVGGTAVALTAIEATITTLLADREARARSITERAFAHLQRLIVADPSVRDRWIEAMGSGELACEKLGACHLLLHGIYAFKVSAGGERTDLVFGDPLELGDAERASPAALVLTEWKVARLSTEIELRLEEARRQANLYASGSMSDLELTSVRYAVVVTTRRHDVAPEVREREIVYRQVIIGVDPDSPSKEARRVQHSA